jgi:glycosyltransferase involved in cell wall biosynthesis
MNKPWRIGLVMEGDSNWMGGVEYIKNIVFAIQSLPDEVKNSVEVCLICDNLLPTELYESIIPYLKDIFQIQKNTSIVSKASWKISKKLLNLKESSPRISRFLSRNSDHNIDFIYPCFTTSKKMDRLSSIAWISDFQHKYLPHLFTSNDIRLRDTEFMNISKYSKTVVVSSQSAKNDYHQFFPESKATVEVLSFTTFPVPKWFEHNPEEIVKIYPIPKKFFLVSNQFWQHKNHELVFRAVSLLKDQGIIINVVCTGNLNDYRNSVYSEKIIAMVQSGEISKQVFILGLIPKDHQVQLMRSALGIIQPSLFEGWSTVVEDARCFGKRIALSNIPVHIEQNPPNALFFDKNDPAQLAVILKTWWEDDMAGFNETEENMARQSNYKRIQDVGYEFMKIAKGENYR